MSGALADGDRLDDRYRLVRLLGRGGMSQVFEAYDERLTRPVAVKVLAAAPGADAVRFRAEIRTLARLDHPNIVRLLDAGELEDGRAYLVMELVVGESLAGHLSGGPLRLAEIARLGAGVAAGLAYVHALGVVHRDVKPANILLGPDERVRLADFGIARLVDTGGLTATGIVLGTPAYLAPEQVTGRPVGPPADIYALGLVLAECATARRVFDGPPSEAAAARLQAAPLALEGVPRSLAPLLARFTAPEPAGRPSAAEAAALLAEIGRGAPTAAAEITTVPLAPSAEAPAATDPVMSWVPASDPRASWRTRRRRTALLAAVGVLALAAGGAALARESLGGTPPHAGARTTADSTLRTSTTAPPTSTTSSSTTSSSTSSTSTSTSSTTTSSSTTSTSTSTSTSTTTSSPATTADAVASGRAAAQLAGALLGGARAGTIAPSALAVLGNDLRQVVAEPGAAALGHLASDLQNAVNTGAVSGASVDALGSGLAALANALGVTVPPLSTTTPTTPPQPGPGGDGHGHGPDGGGPPGSHGH